MSKSKFKLELSQNNILTCIIYALIGLMLIILQSSVLGILMTIIGVLLIVLGIVDIAKTKNLTKGIIETVAGVAIIVCGWLIADIVLLMFGILLIFKGIIEVANTYKNGFMSILSSIVTIVIGILLVISKWTLMDTICIIAGAIFVINSILALFGKQVKLSK